MPGQKVIVELDAQEAKLVAAWQRGRKSVDEFASSIESITPEATKADNATKSLGASADKWLKAISTPLQNYLGDLDELKSLLAAGKLSQDQYNASIELSKQKLEAQNVEIDELGLKAAKLRDKLVTPQQEFQKELDEANTLLKAGKISQDEFAAAAERAKVKLDAQDKSLQAIKSDAASLKASLVTPQEQYSAALTRANQLLQAGEINQQQYALAADQAKLALDAQDKELQSLLASARQVQAALITPQQQYNQKLQDLDRLLKAGKISQEDYRRSVAALKQEYVATTQAGQTMAKSGQEGLKGISMSGREVVSTVTAMAAGFGVVQKAVSAVIAENHRLGQSITDVFRKLDQEELKMQIQAGLTPQQAQAQMPNIERALLTTPSTTVAGAIQLQTQLASSGFKEEDINSGAALQTVLDLKAATNQFGESMGNEQQAVLALSQYLKGMGQDSNAANIKQLGKQLVTLFATSDIQFGDLQQLAPNAGALKEFGLNDKEQLAAFSTLVDVMGGEKAATGTRNVVTRLATAAASKERTAALKELGLKPEDVDIAVGGDEFIPTLEKVSKALKSKKPEDANRLLSKIFGEEGQAAASNLFNPEKIALIKQRIAEQEGGAAFDLGVATFQQSSYADRQRRQVKTDMSLRQAGRNQQGGGRQDVRELGQQAVAQAAAEGGTLTAPSGVGEAFFSAGEGLGMTPEQTAQWIQFVALRQDRSWGGFLTGQRAKPALKFGQKPPPGNRGLPPPQPAAGKPDMAPAAGGAGQPEFKPSPLLQDLAESVQASSSTYQSVNGPAIAVTPSQLNSLTQALQANTVATQQNSQKPPVVVKKPISAPTKTPPSAALAAAGGR